MSTSYHAQQYNEPFKPTHLRNWRFGDHDFPGRYPCPRSCPTNFIAYNNGHLYPHIARNGCTSPWGDYRTCIWEEKIPCVCVDLIRNPREYTKPRNMIMVTHEVPCPAGDAQGVCDAFNAPNTPECAQPGSPCDIAESDEAGAEETEPPCPCA